MRRSELVASASQTLVVAHHHHHFENRGPVDVRNIETNTHWHTPLDRCTDVDKAAQAVDLAAQRTGKAPLLVLQRHELAVPDYLGSLEAPTETHPRALILQLTQQHEGLAGAAQIFTEDGWIAAQRSWWNGVVPGNQSGAVTR